jgi:hypothetical protein
MSRDFSVLRYFPCIIFPQAPENNIRVIAIVFENSQRYSQVKVQHRYQRHRWQICTSVNNTGGKFASVVNYTVGNFVTSNNDTGEKAAMPCHAVNISKRPVRAPRPPPHSPEVWFPLNCGRLKMVLRACWRGFFWFSQLYQNTARQN